MNADLSFNYLHPARTTPQQPQNLLRPTNKGISDCGCSGNIADSYGLGGLSGFGELPTLLNNGVLRSLTRPLAGLGQDQMQADGSYRPSRYWWIYSLVGITCGLLGAYHGFKRNDSVGWAFAWYLFGAWFPAIALPVAIAQGFGKPARRGTSGFNGRMKRALGRARRRK